MRATRWVKDDKSEAIVVVLLVTLCIVVKWLVPLTGVANEMFESRRKMLSSIMSTSLLTYIGQKPLFLSSFVHFVFYFVTKNQQNRDRHLNVSLKVQTQGDIFIKGNATWYMSRTRGVKREGGRLKEEGKDNVD